MTESIQILMEKDRLQPLADNIKVLKGSDTITLQQMEDTIEETNTDIVSQTDLISRLTSALQGKSVPGGGEDVTAETETYTNLLTDLEAAVDALPDTENVGTSIETCTVTYDRNTTADYTIITTRVLNGQITSQKETVTATAKITHDDYVRGSTIIVPNCTDYSGDIVLLRADTSYSIFALNGDATIYYRPCFARNTLILLADGTTKPVQDITYDDTLLIWDFDNGCYSAAHPLWIKQEQTASYYYCCEFDNGTELKLVGSNGRCHRVFSLDRNMFESATECVGERVMTNNGVAKLVSCERIDEPIEFYNIITDTHLNLYAEGLLTSCRLNNLYPIKDMKFVKDDREVLPLDAYEGIEENFYRGLRLAEQKSENVGMTNSYVANLYRLQKEV